MKCKCIRKKLIDYVDEILSPDERSLVQEHIAECDSCRQEAELLKKLSRLIYKVDYPPASIWESFLPDLHKRIEKEAALTFEKEQKQHSYITWGWASVAVTILIFFSILALRNYPYGKAIQVHNIPSVENQYTPLLAESSESVFVAGVISKVLLTESEAAKLKNLKNPVDSEDMATRYHSDDSILMDINEENGTENDKENTGSSLESKITELAESYPTEPDDIEPEML